MKHSKEARATAQKYYIEMIGRTGYENKYPLSLYGRAFGGLGCTDKRLNEKRNRKKLHSEGVFIKAKADLVSVNGSYSGKIFGTEVTVSGKINIGFWYTYSVGKKTNVAELLFLAVV